MYAISSANCDIALTLTSRDLPFGESIQLPFAVLQLQGFVQESAITVATQDQFDIAMSLEGHQLVGYVANNVEVTINLIAASPSRTNLDLLSRTHRAARTTTYEANLTIIQRDILRVHVFTGGVMQTVQPMANLETSLGNVPYVFSFEDWTFSPV